MYKKINNPLILDKHTGRNLCIVEEKGNSFKLVRELTTTDYIQHRSEKSLNEKKARTKINGEVFTGHIMVNPMIRILISSLFEILGGSSKMKRLIGSCLSDAIVQLCTWISLPKIIGLMVLEPTCGEAPFLVTRYDACDSSILSMDKRCGVLDLKMKALNKTVLDERTWCDYARMAIQTTYAFDLQGDNVYLARTNIMNSLSDYYKAKFGSNAELPDGEQDAFAEILSYNIIQMDVNTGCVPHEPHLECMLVDWRTKEIFSWQKLLNKKMKKHE